VIRHPVSASQEDAAAMSILEEYVRLLEVACQLGVEKDMSSLEVFQCDVADVRRTVSRLVAIRKQLLSARDHEDVRGCLATGLLPDADPERRIASFCVCFELEGCLKEARLRRSCEPYCRTQPLFAAAPSLWSNVRNRDSGVPELLSVIGLQWDASGQIVCLEGTRARIHSRLNPMLCSWLRHEFPAESICIRIDPYTVGPDLKPCQYEDVLRPADPTWWQQLRVWPGHKRASTYLLQDCDVRENPQKYWEYHARKIERLEVCFQRDTSGLLKGTLEEVPRAGQDDLSVGLCLHLTSDSAVGTNWDAATMSHVDGAINAYVREDADLRRESSLERGKVQSATFRTHLFRVDHAPLYTLIPVAIRFFRSGALLGEWLADQFGEHGAAGVKNA